MNLKKAMYLVDRREREKPMFLQSAYRSEFIGPSTPTMTSFQERNKYAIELKLFIEFSATAAQRDRAEEEARKRLYASVFGGVRALAEDAMSALHMGDEGNLRKALIAILDETKP